MNDKLNEVLQRQRQQIQEPSDSFDLDQTEQLVCFMVGEEEYAIPILYIKEIIKPIEYTRVPSVPDYVLGVFNLRGSVVPLIDLRIRFGTQATKMTEDTRYIVAIHEDNIAGFIIDCLTKSIRMRKDQIEQPPETLVREKGMVAGIGKREDSILTILSIESLLSRDF